MTSVMTKRTILPVWLALVLLLAAAVWWQQGGPVWADDPEEGQGAHEHADHAAPAVTLAAQSVCNSSTNRTVILARFEATGGASGYQQQVAWGHDPSLSADDRPWGPVASNTRTGNRPWPLRLNQEPEVGKAYSLRVRALDDDGNHGPWGEATYEYSEGTAAAPAGVAVSDVDGDYSRAILSWRDGSDGAGNGFWFKVQRRVSGGGADGWQESRWTKVEQRGSGDEKSYRHTVTGLDPAQAHDFRVAGQKRDCGATKWSSVVSLSPPAPPPAPDYTVTVDYEDGAVSLVVTPSNAPAGITGYTLRHRVKGSDADYVKVSADPDDAADGIEVSGVSHGQTYRVGLRASNQVGDGEYAYRDVTVASLPDPPGFTVEPQYGADAVSLVVKVTDSVSGDIGYVVRVNGNDTAVTPAQVSGAGYSVPAQLGTKYTVALATVSHAGQGAFSATQTLTTLSLPSAPDVTAEAQYSGGSASILVSAAAADAAEALQGYALRYLKVGDEESERVGRFLIPAVAQAGYSFDAELGASYAVKVTALNPAGAGPDFDVTVAVKEKAGTPDFTAEAVYADGKARVVVKVQNAPDDATGYSVRYRASAAGPWTTSDVSVAEAKAGWSFAAVAGTDYTVGVAARTEVGLGDYGSATVSIVEEVYAPMFTVTFARGNDGAEATVAVSNPQDQAKYHVFSIGDSAPVKVAMPDAGHEFAVELGNTYRIGVAAGNELGTGEYAYRDILAVVVPDPPTFKMSPVYRKGEAHLAVQVSSPDPHATRYLLKVGDADAVVHTDVTGLHVQVVPGETYTVGLAAGNAAGESAFTEVTRVTTVEEFEALLEWRLIVPDQATPAEAVGAATQYVAIVDGKPVRYDPVSPCVGRETALAQSGSDQATALAAWIEGMTNAPAGLTAYAVSHKSAMSDALKAVKTAATTTCQARYPEVESLGQDDARWVRMPR